MTLPHVPTSQVKVGLCFHTTVQPVGRLVLRDKRIFFQFDTSFIAQGIEISPFRCPLQPDVRVFDRALFRGLPGVFDDSLPDGWGRLLLDRQMRLLGILPNELTPLDRLAHVGGQGMGALIYEPDYAGGDTHTPINIDVLAVQAAQVLAGEGKEVLEQLRRANGSSAGARPKATIGLHANKTDVIHDIQGMPAEYQPWLVKFPNTNDGEDAGAIEYVYALMARLAGLKMPAVHLFPAQHGAGYFAVQRFDREDGERRHMHTACGLLHADFRLPSLDYTDLIALTTALTKDMREIEDMFRLAVFNVLAHNRDDHGKNFSFLMSASGEWRLSPPYDLTFSAGLEGEQTTMVNGEGRRPSKAHLVALGKEAGLPRKTIDAVIEQTLQALAQWVRLAEEYGVSRDNVVLIGQRMAGVAST